MTGELFPSAAAAQLVGKSPISDAKSRAGRLLKSAADGARNGQTLKRLTNEERHIFRGCHHREEKQFASRKEEEARAGTVFCCRRTLCSKIKRYCNLNTTVGVVKIGDRPKIRRGHGN